ncbi:MAG: hypothetical protein HND52_15115 [Ignavibacteriae bacterium]|nr:hypothetical protein [Ignavibacteriota bacterium]NOG99285.1 hypothetical protein [Ignavibacteriota bacterium]
MVINSFLYLLLFSGISIGFCALGFVIAYFFQSHEIAYEFFNAWVFDFNGIMVGGIGYGLMWYIIKDGKKLLAMLNNIFDVNQMKNLNIVYYAHKSTSIKLRLLFGIPITLIGGLVLWLSGYPLEGFSKYYLAACSISIYFVGSTILLFFIYVILIFRTLEENQNNNIMSKPVSSLEYETLNNFLTITASIGILGIYIGFRGTLSANLDIFAESEIMRKLFVFPIFLFLPVTLVYSFYPRFILKKFFDLEIIQQLRKLENIKISSLNDEILHKDKLAIENIASQIKEKLIAERKLFPIINYKDSPSLLLVILIILQFIIQYDKRIHEYFNIF